MAQTDSSLWERLNVALAVILKLILLATFAVVVASLALCSEPAVKESSKWTFKRLELAGFKPTKVSLGVFEFQAVTEAATGTEVGNALGLASDLRRIAADPKTPAPASMELRDLADQVETYSKQLASRDKKILSAVRDIAELPASDSGPVVGWIYVGRRAASGAWAPISDSVSLDDSTNPRTISIRKDTVLVERDPEIPTQEETGQAKTLDAVRILRTTDQPLQILEIKSTNSIGNGRFQWVQVKVQPKDLYVARR